MATDTSTYGAQVANTLLGGFQTGMQLGGMLQQARLAIRQQQLNEARFGLQQRQMVLEEANFQRKQQEFMMETEKWNLSKIVLNQQIQANENLTEVQKAEAQNRFSMALQTQKAQLQWQKFSPDIADALQSDAVQRMQAFTEGKAPPTNERLTQLYRLMPEVMASKQVQEMIKAKNAEVFRFMESYRMTHQGRAGELGGVAGQKLALLQQYETEISAKIDTGEITPEQGANILNTVRQQLVSPTLLKQVQDVRDDTFKMLQENLKNKLLLGTDSAIADQFLGYARRRLANAQDVDMINRVGADLFTEAASLSDVKADALPRHWMSGATPTTPTTPSGVPQGTTRTNMIDGVEVIFRRTP